MKDILLYTSATLLMKSLKITISNEELLKQKSIFIFWHGRMLCGWWLFRNSSPGAIVSKSKDGELLSYLLKKWGYTLFRGSSSSDGKIAMVKLIENESSLDKIVLTPDGPRGPAYKLKNEVLSIALKTGLPIVPIKIEYCRFKRVNSWDEFEIPYPFTECIVTVSEPVYYDSFLSGEKLKDFKLYLQGKMI